MNKPHRIKIVLVEPSHPGNIGASARAAKTMGIESLALVNPKSFPDSHATARATDAVDVLERAEVCNSLQEAIADCTFVVGTSARARGLSVPEILLQNLGKRVWQEINQGNVAIVFGRESSGLSNKEMDLCHGATTIPTSWEFASLNLSAAVQVVCYEIFTATLENIPSEKNEEEAMATVEELENYFKHLEEVLYQIEFLNPKQPKLLMRRLRHLYNRTRLTQTEVNILRGILSCTQRMIGLNSSK